MMRVKHIKKTALWFFAFLILFSAVSLIRGSLEKNRDWVNPYLDVNENMWSYSYITELNKAGVFPDQEKFEPSREQTRGDMILSLYNMDTGVFEKREKQAYEEKKEVPAFTDVPEDSDYYDAVCWSYRTGLSSGSNETTFGLDSVLTREQVCTILARFAALENLSLIKVMEPAQFDDSLDIQNYARSGVTACQISGIVKGYDDNCFYPAKTMSRQECAAVIYRIMTAAELTIPEGTELVDLTPGAYDPLYSGYKYPVFEALVPTSAQPGDVSFFDEAVFIGDSISLTLESYCGSSGTLGDAQFLCAGSMSPTNMLTGQILPEYPKGSGKKPPIEESVAASGASVVYIMLGMDNIAFGLEKSTGDYLTVIQNILARNPGVQIIIQSVTPMMESSSVYSAKLNKDTIEAFNQRMLEHCQANGWYFVNVAEKFKDEQGFLKPEYCSDKSSMGMHFTYAGAKVWVEYLIDHIPEELTEE